MAGLSGEQPTSVPPWELPGGPPTVVAVPPPGPAAPSAAWNTPGAGNRQWQSAGQPPLWPTPPRRRQRRRWLGLVSTVVTIAIAAGVWYYVWNQTNGKLHITRAAIAPGKQPVGCNGTTDIIGTIDTNGRGGPISYEWLVAGQKPVPLVVDDGSGQGTVKVTLTWTLHAKGTGQSVVELHVLSPDDDRASITFPYTCPA